MAKLSGIYLAQLVTCLLLSSLQLQHAAPTDTSSSLTGSVLKDLGHIRKDIYSFWQQHGPDGRFGGFYGTLDRAGEPRAPTSKGLVQEARHVWAFSTFFLHGYHTSAQTSSTPARPTATLRRPNGRLLQQQQQRQQLQQQQLQQRQQQQQLLNSQQMAKTAYDFVVKHMHDPSTDMFHWMTTQDGQLLQDNKVIYGQWFALYGLSQYHTAFGDATARQLALRCFRAMDAAWHSTTYGGLDEIPENAIPPSPPDKAMPTAMKVAEAAATRRPSAAAAAAAAAARRPATAAAAAAAARRPATAGAAVARRPAAAAAARPQREQKVRTLNVAMHGLEALTALHKATKDPVVLARILEYLRILCTRLQRTEGLIFEEYVPAPEGSNKLWQPAPGSVVNYGHNLESTWLVADTLEYLLSIRAIRPALAKQYRQTVMSIGAAAVRDGFDTQNGGIFESGQPLLGPQSKVKVWWVQAESMLALWKLHEYYGLGEGAAAAAAAAAQGSKADAAAGGRLRYLRVLAETAEFVRKFSTDGAGGGEMFWQVNADGSWAPSGNLERDTKGNKWKASYHNSRAVLYLEKWIRDSS